MKGDRFLLSGYVERGGVLRRERAQPAVSPARAPGKAAVKAAARKKEPSEPERVMMRHLGILKATKLIRDFECQPDVIRLADDCGYTVDFRLEFPDGSIVFIETKGTHKFEDSIIKWKWGAMRWPEAIFVLAERHGSRTIGYRWKYTFRQGRARIIGKERAALMKRIGGLLP